MLIMNIDNLGDITLQNAKSDIISFRFAPEMVLKEIQEESDDFRRNNFITEGNVNQNQGDFTTIISDKVTTKVKYTSEDHLCRPAFNKMSSESADSDGDFKDVDTEFDDSESTSFEESISALRIGPSDEDSCEDVKSDAERTDDVADTSADDSIEVVLNPLTPPFLPKKYRELYGGDQATEAVQNGIRSEMFFEAHSSSDIVNGEIADHDDLPVTHSYCSSENNDAEIREETGQVESNSESSGEYVEAVSTVYTDPISGDMLGAVGGEICVESNEMSQANHQFVVNNGTSVPQPQIVVLPSNRQNGHFIHHPEPSNGMTFVVQPQSSLQEPVPLDNIESLSEFRASSSIDNAQHNTCSHRQFLYGNFDPSAPPQLMPYHVTYSNSSVSSIESRPSSLSSSMDGSIDYQFIDGLGNINYETTWYNPCSRHSGGSTPEIFSQPTTPTEPGLFPSTPSVSETQTDGQPFQYPAIYVSESGLMTLLLKHDISLEMTVDRTLRLVSHQRKLVIATNNRGNSSTLVHPAVRMVQRGTTTDVELFMNRRARMATDCIMFGNNFKNYKFDHKFIDETDASYEDISKDLSVNLLFSCSGYGVNVAPECMNLVAQAQFENFQHGGFAVHINGVKIIQNARGDVSVISGPKFLRLSPNSSVLRLQTHFIDVDVETNWCIKLRRGCHTLNASHLGLVVSNGKIEAGFDGGNKMHAVVLPRRIPLALGIRRSRRPGSAARRPRVIRARTQQAHQEQDHSCYTLPSPSQ